MARTKHLIAKTVAEERAEHASRRTRARRHFPRPSRRELRSLLRMRKMASPIPALHETRRNSAEGQRRDPAKDFF